MKRRTIEKNRIRKDCWDLDFAFIKWLNSHLKVYKKDASKIVDLTYHTYIYNDKELTQIEIIDKLISLTNELLNMSNVDFDYAEKTTEMLNLWTLVFPAMWW